MEAGFPLCLLKLGHHSSSPTRSPTSVIASSYFACLTIHPAPEAHSSFATTSASLLLLLLACVACLDSVAPFGLCSTLQASLSVTCARQTDDTGAAVINFFSQGTPKCWMRQLDKMKVLNKIQVLDEMLDTDSSAEELA